MKKEKIKEIVMKIASGELTPEAALEQLNNSKGLDWSLVGESPQGLKQGLIYKVENGKLFSLPVKQGEKELRLYYRTIKK